RGSPSDAGARHRVRHDLRRGDLHRRSCDPESAPSGPRGLGAAALTTATRGTMSDPNANANASPDAPSWRPVITDPALRTRIHDILGEIVAGLAAAAPAEGSLDARVDRA